MATLVSPAALEARLAAPSPPLVFECRNFFRGVFRHLSTIVMNGHGVSVRILIHILNGDHAVQPG